MRKLITISILAISVVAIAQPNNYEEQVYLQLNRTNLLVGEDLLFSAFVYSTNTKKLSSLSSILYLDLIDENGTSVFRQKIGLRDGRGSGGIELDPSLSSGTYRLVAFTRWMKNFEAYFQESILIFNPYNGIHKGRYIVGGAKRRKESEIETSDKLPSLQPSEIIIDNVEASSVSISISKSHLLYYDNQISHAPPVEIESFEYLPEYKYGLIQGQVDVGSEEPKRINISIRGRSMQVKTAKTDETGRFWMYYNPEWADKVGYLISSEPGDLSLEYVSEYYDTYPETPIDSLLIDSALADELVKRSVESQIEKVYESELIFEEVSDVNFLPFNAFIYKLAEYERFTSMRDTFIELVPYVGVSKSEDNYKIIVRCNGVPDLYREDEKPLILLDGVIVSNKDILDLSPNDVERIEVLPEYYFLDDIYFNGVVSVHTVDKNLASVLPKGTPVQFADYIPYTSKTVEIDLSNERLPNLASQVYWNPIVDHSGGDLRIKFNTPRQTGIFEIRINGLSKSGKAINISRFIEVQETSLN